MDGKHSNLGPTPSVIDRNTLFDGIFEAERSDSVRQLDYKRLIKRTGVHDEAVEDFAKQYTKF